MIEPTDEMRTAAYRVAREWAVQHRHALPDDRMLDAALAAVLAIVERDNIVRNKLSPEALQCGHRRWGLDCQLPPAHYGNHGHSTWTAWA